MVHMKQKVLLLCKYEVKQVEDRIRALADAHYIDHVLEWSAQKYSVSERRIWMTQWAWEPTHTRNYRRHRRT